MRLNLGCGWNKRDGWVNVDSAEACEPDVVLDIETTPWPWPDDSAETVILSHVLEHIGETKDAYFRFLKELWRVCRDGAEVMIAVPHPRHDDFLNDPTHVRAVTAHSFSLFSRKRNRQWREQGGANTPLGVYLGIDFDLIHLERNLDPRWAEKVKAGELSKGDLRAAIAERNNVVKEDMIILHAVKTPDDGQTPAPTPSQRIVPDAGS